MAWGMCGGFKAGSRLGATVAALHPKPSLYLAV